MPQLQSQSIEAFWFTDACDRARADLLTRATIIDLKNHEYLLHQGDESQAVYLVQSGQLASIHVNKRGEQFTIRLIHPGQSLGELQFASEPRVHNSIHSVGASRVAKIEHSDLKEVARDHPEILVGLTKTVNAMLSNVVQMLNLAMLAPVRDRIRWRLLVEATDARKDQSDWVEIELAQSELADMTGVSRQVLNRELKSLSDAGALCLGYRKMSVNMALMNQVLDPMKVT